MKKLLCLLKGWWWTIEAFIKTGNADITVRGCSFKEKERHRGCTVMISQCEDCGKVDISWCKDDDTLSL